MRITPANIAVATIDLRFAAAGVKSHIKKTHPKMAYASHGIGGQAITTRIRPNQEKRLRIMDQRRGTTHAASTIAAPGYRDSPEAK